MRRPLIGTTVSFPSGAAGGKDALFLAYLVLFHLAWVAWPFVVYPRLLALGDRTLAYAVANLTIRLLVWVAPVWLYLRLVDGVEPLAYLKLDGNIRRGIIIALLLTALNLLGSIARFGWPHPSMHSVTWNSVLGTSLLVGFIEEIPYRGFMLPKLGERMNFWLANLTTSILFVAVHAPGWTALHVWKAETTVFVFVFGVVMAIVFRYSKSLWAPIVTHSTNDFISVVLFHR